MSTGTYQQRRPSNGNAPQHDDDESTSIELVAPQAVSIARLEIDTQVATAKQYPRSLTQCLRNAKALATLNPDIAASCTYVLPARRGGNGQPIIGPSVRLAEIVSSAWGNMRVESRVTDDDGRFVTAESMCWDLESNLAVKVQKKRRVTDSKGRRYSDDMVNVTCNAAISVALRDAVFRVVPRTYVEQIRLEAAAVVTGDVETFQARRDKCLAYFAGKGVDAARVFFALQIKGVDDLTPEHFVLLRAIETSIRNGEQTIDQAFPSVAPVEGEVQGPNESRSEFLARTLAGKTTPKEPAPTPPEATTLPQDEPKASEATKRMAKQTKPTEVEIMPDLPEGREPGSDE